MAKTPKTQLHRTSLAEQIELYLRDEIMRGNLPGGARIVELEIAEQMGTSQSPVREALHRLEQAGFVERHSGSATFVTAISPDEMYEIAVVRKTVEGLAIRQTAKCITAEQCDELSVLVADMHTAADANDMASLSTCDLTFHQRICTWADKPTLLRAWTTLYYQQQRYLIATHPHVFPDLHQVADLHQPIIERLRTKDSEGSCLAIQDHIMWLWAEHRLRPDLFDQ
ncbi:MAG: GntR family transcriptional regulator [Caldilineales bacterium]|nr:GntR family transcriptional regulator [Caldilineales bacterium]